LLIVVFVGPFSLFVSAFIIFQVVLILLVELIIQLLYIYIFASLITLVEVLQYCLY